MICILGRLIWKWYESRPQIGKSVSRKTIAATQGQNSKSLFKVEMGGWRKGT